MNNDWYEWIFSGIGTSVLTGLLGLIIGGISGYQICKHKSKIKQFQKAGKDSKQKQFGSKNIAGNNNNEVIQIQKAKDNAEQVQIGEH